MKQRFSSLDVKVIAHELSAALCTLRLANIYDLSSRIFLLKFAKPDHRQQLVVESGFRCHLSSFARTTATEPSAFVARLRKFLRTRRVTKVSQIGTDRVIELQFNEGQYRLLLEFYAGGNVILTDSDYKVIALLRIVNTGDEQDELRVGLRYSVENRQNYSGIPPLTKERIRQGLKAVQAKDAANLAAGKKQKKQSASGLRKALAVSLTEFPPMLLDHALRVNTFDSSLKIEDVTESDEKLDSLMLVLSEAQSVIDQVTRAPVARGFIAAKPMKRRNPPADVKDEEHEFDKENESLIYEEFHPFRPRQFEDEPGVRILEYNGFNATVDEFFSSLESQKLETRLTEREETARRRLQNAKDDHVKRLAGLQQVQELNVRRAQAIESNTQRVEEAKAAVNGLVAQGMDWVEIARLVEMEQARSNPVAEMIKLPLKLYENTITLLLAEEIFDDEEGEADLTDETDSEISDSEDEPSDQKAGNSNTKPEDKRLAVDVDLSLSAWSNARQYYDQKKTAANKEQKTMESSALALKSTEQKIQADLRKGLKDEKQALRPIRKQLWFEKFFYFISSEGYLVIGGRDSQQNDMLYRRYLDKGDCWVHADLNGASCLVIKNKPGMSDSPVPISTLAQAGSFCAATSSAWESKAIMAAWWVDCEQVSKLDGHGGYLGAGVFNIHGKKNFLPPAQLLLGFGVMFRVSEESKRKHTKNRALEDRTVSVTGGANKHDDEVQKQDSDAEDPSDEDVEAGPEDKTIDAEDIDMGSESEEEHEKDDGGDSDLKYSNPLQSVPQFPEATTKMKRLSLDDDSHEEDNQGNETEEEEKDAESTGTSAPAVDQAASLTVESPATKFQDKQEPQVRGKKGKRSKIKAKYADQDDEDRALAMQLLGSSVGQQKAKAEAEIKAKKEEEQAALKERRRQQHAASQTSGKEAEEERRLKFDKGIPMMEKEELDELAMVDNFVGTPMAGDDILDGLVVCGPWDAMGAKLLWRIKIQPGTQKKGKAVKEILAGWGRLIGLREKKKLPAKDAPGYEAEITMRKQAELVKIIRDSEVIGCVPVSKVRVEMKGAGGERGKGAAAKGGSKGGGGGKRGGKGGKKK